MPPYESAQPQITTAETRSRLAAGPHPQGSTAATGSLRATAVSRCPRWSASSHVRAREAGCWHSV